jgi:TRAP-type C4-dicarboxylate transport system permease large subunit
MVVNGRRWYGDRFVPAHAIPLFIMAGNLMNAGKITTVIFSTASGWLAVYRAAGARNVVASIIFAGMSLRHSRRGRVGTIEMEA